MVHEIIILDPNPQSPKLGEAWSADGRACPIVQFTVNGHSEAFGGL